MERWYASTSPEPVVPSDPSSQAWLKCAEMLLHAQTPKHVKAAKNVAGRAWRAWFRMNFRSGALLQQLHSLCNVDTYVKFKTSTQLQHLAKAPAEAVGMEGGGDDGGFMFRLWALSQKFVSSYWNQREALRVSFSTADGKASLHLWAKCCFTFLIRVYTFCKDQLLSAHRYTALLAPPRSGAPARGQWGRGTGPPPHPQVHSQLPPQSGMIRARLNTVVSSYTLWWHLMSDWVLEVTHVSRKPPWLRGLLVACMGYCKKQVMTSALLRCGLGQATLSWKLVRICVVFVVGATVIFVSCLVVVSTASLTCLQETSSRWHVDASSSHCQLKE